MDDGRQTAPVPEGPGGATFWVHMLGVPLELRPELEQTLRLIADADAVLSKHGKSIRSALGAAEHEALIGTVRNVGYRFVTQAEDSSRVNAG